MTITAAVCIIACYLPVSCNSGFPVIFPFVSVVSMLYLWLPCYLAVSRVCKWLPFCNSDCHVILLLAKSRVAMLFCYYSSYIRGAMLFCY